MDNCRRYSRQFLLTRKSAFILLVVLVIIVLCVRYNQSTVPSKIAFDRRYEDSMSQFGSQYNEPVPMEDAAELDVDEDTANTNYSVLMFQTTPGIKITPQLIERSLRLSNPPNRDVIMEYIANQETFTFKPPLPLLTNITNPCFITDRKSDGRQVTRCLPGFYLAGFPRCGTTDLWFRLQSLPGIVESPIKESHWWTRYRFPNASDTRGGDMEYYADLFKELNIRSKTTQLAGDGSQSTVWDDYSLQTRTKMLASRALTNALLDYQLHSIHLIKTFTPDAKFIIMFRDPVERLYSEYLFYAEDNPDMEEARNNLTLSQEMFHQVFLQARQEIYECFVERGIRNCVYDIGVRKAKYESQIRLQVGIYAVYIHALLQTFPNHQVLAINLNEYSQQRPQVLKRVCDFLDIDCRDDDIERVNKLRMPDARRRVRRPGDMWPKTKRLIDDFYRPFNRVLAKLLRDDSLKFDDDS